MSLLWSDLLVLSIGIVFTKTDAKERPLTRLTMSALQAYWLGLILSISDVRAQIVHSLLILRVTYHRAVGRYDWSASELPTPFFLARARSGTFVFCECLLDAAS